MFVLGGRNAEVRQQCAGDRTSVHRKRPLLRGSNVRPVRRGGSGGSNETSFFVVGYVPVRMLEKCNSANEQRVMANCSLDGNKSKDQTLAPHFSQRGLLQGL